MTRGGLDRSPPALLIPAGLGVLLVVLPLVGLLGRVRWPDLGAQLGDREVLTALRLSVETSTLAAGVSVLIGVPLAHALARSSLPGEGVIRSLTILPLVLPPVVGGIALQSAFGRASPLGTGLRQLLGISLPFTTAGVVIAEAFVAFPLVVITVESGLRQAGRQYEEVAATLGAGPWRRFWTVTLPLILPSLSAGAALAWARALGEFGATITFAGNFPGATQTLPLAAYAAFEGAGDSARAIALALIVLLISIAILVGLALLQSRRPGSER